MLLLWGELLLQTVGKSLKLPDVTRVLCFLNLFVWLGFPQFFSYFRDSRKKRKSISDDQCTRCVFEIKCLYWQKKIIKANQQVFYTKISLQEFENPQNCWEVSDSGFINQAVCHNSGLKWFTLHVIGHLLDDDGDDDDDCTAMLDFYATSCVSRTIETTLVSYSRCCNVLFVENCWGFVLIWNEEGWWIKTNYFGL